MHKGRDIHELLSPAEPPRGLRARVLERLRAAERRHARVWFSLWSLVAILSGMAFVPAALYTQEQFASSGFMSYFSLLFSDSSLVAIYWREFSLSLLESLPSLALLLLVPILAALFFSIKRARMSARGAFLRFS